MATRPTFRSVIVIACCLWLLASWTVQVYVDAEQATLRSRPVSKHVPAQQACGSGPDLQIQSIRVEPDPPGVDQSYNVHVDIVNAGIMAGTADSWTFLYVDRAPPSNPQVEPPDVQAFSPTGGLDNGATVSAHFTITRGNAYAGWHSISVYIDALDNVDETSCSGEGNNTSAISFEILQVYTPTPTPTNPPTPTPFPPPQIYLFTPAEATVARGDSVTLRWQVYGEALSVYLNGELVPREDTRVIYPTDTRVHTLRAENPGGSVVKTSTITIVDPTATPTPTNTPCAYATIHEFGASPSSVVRGGTTTIYWDVAGATQVLLNGESVSAVSERKLTLKQTTTFTLVGRNACGDVEESLTVQATYATPTLTPIPTRTNTPTRAPTPTFTRAPPTATPTRRVLPTLTPTPVPGTVSVTPGTVTVTPGTETPPATDQAPGTVTATATGTSSAFESPLGTPTLLATSTPEATETLTLTASPSAEVATGTPSVVETASVPTWTPYLTETASVPTWTPYSTATAFLALTPDATATLTVPATVVADNPVVGVPPTGLELTATPVPAAGSLRMYLCPLSILIVFAAGVLFLSIVLPRIQQRGQGQEDYVSDFESGVHEQTESRLGATTPSDDVLSDLSIDDLVAPEATAPPPGEEVHQVDSGSEV